MRLVGIAALLMLLASGLPEALAATSANTGTTSKKQDQAAVSAQKNPSVKGTQKATSREKTSKASAVPGTGKAKAVSPANKAAPAKTATARSGAKGTQKAQGKKSAVNGKSAKPKAIAAKGSTPGAQKTKGKKGVLSGKSAKPKAVSARKGASPKKLRQKRSISTKASNSRLAPPYKSAVIINAATGKVIFSRHPNRQIPPASLTKILSIYVAEDAIRARKLNANTLVRVSPKAAAAKGSRMGLSTGDRVPLRELLHGMAVSSGNDASIAVAEYIGGSEQKFVQMMNRKARALGMSRSTFRNASGLPAKGQFTTAKDMLLLARSYLKAYPANLQRHHNQAFNSYRGNLTSNANPLLRGFAGADGLKTGFVSAAGYNLIATAQRNGQRVIGVILGARTSAVRATEACALMESSFSRPASLTAQCSPTELAAIGGTKQAKPTATAKAPARPTKKAALASSQKKPAKVTRPQKKSKQAAKAKNTASKKQKSRKSL